MMKQNIRKKLLDKRNQLTHIQVNQLSLIICRKILEHDCFINNNNIAMYYPMGKEVSLSPLFQQPKKIVLPVIQPYHRMQFKRFRSHEELTANKYGILEPSNNDILQHKDIECCLMPLSGFNTRGDRLGMGGGYYDRYFELNKFQKKPTILIGVAYDFQEDDTIRSEPWDIPLDLIITDKRIIQL